MISLPARRYLVRRTLLWCAALVVVPVPARADSASAPAETVIRLTVQPMAAPRPALRYVLLPELREMNPGNPIANYLRCLMDHDVADNSETFGRAALRQADRAARLDTPDWQLLPKLKAEGISLLLPDVQKMRSLARGLQDRFRSEVALGHFDDAITTAKTLFAMSRHMGEHPTLIGDLVGIAIAYVAIGPLEDMLQQPGCPNLYWALTNLPHPLVPLDKGTAGERLVIAAEFPQLNDRAPMSMDQIRKVIRHVDVIQGIAGEPEKGPTRAWLNARLKDKAALAAARRRLVESGVSEGRLARFPPDQVILLDEYLAYEVLRDEGMKVMNLPAWQAEKVWAGRPEFTRNMGLFGFLVPAVEKVHRAQARLEQRVALLRHVEALRLYAAAHGGRLPAKLADVAVPLPDDPFTGKPFRYRLDGTTAHLRGTPPKAEKDNAAYNIHYEIAIRK
jgi:hypothetical protein